MKSKKNKGLQGFTGVQNGNGKAPDDEDVAVAYGLKQVKGTCI